MSGLKGKSWTRLMQEARRAQARGRHVRSANLVEKANRAYQRRGDGRFALSLDIEGHTCITYSGTDRTLIARFIGKKVELTEYRETA